MQNYVRITIFYDAPMGRNKVYGGRSIAAKIPETLMQESVIDDLHDMCYGYLRIDIKDVADESKLSWSDVHEWEFATIPESELNDNAYDAEVVDTNYFYNAAAQIMS